MPRPITATMHLGAIENNLQVVRRFAPGAKVWAVVKANAYGHGAVPVAKKLEELGCDMLAVACVAEAAQLRQAGITLP
uniref:alanine racemase n=1 Tax=uncultured Serratia sp. TaxID=239175 RepID=UPI0025966111